MYIEWKLMTRYCMISLLTIFVLYSCSSPYNTLKGTYTPNKYKLKYNTGGDWFVFYPNKRFTYGYSTEVRDEHSQGNYEIIGNKLEISSDTNTKCIPIKIIQTKEYNPNLQYFIIKIHSLYADSSALNYFLITIGNKHDTIIHTISSYDSISMDRNIIFMGIMVKVSRNVNITPYDYNLVYFSRMDSVRNNNNVFHIIFDFPYGSYESYHTFNKEKFIIENRKKIFSIKDSLTYYRK